MSCHPRNKKPLEERDEKQPPREQRTYFQPLDRPPDLTKAFTHEANSWQSSDMLSIMKIQSVRGTLLVASMGLVVSLSAETVKLSSHETHETFSIKTAGFAVNFQVGDDGRLFQQVIGQNEVSKIPRWDEAYPQWGDGYILEPALQVVHADGNTSTTLHYDSVTRANEGAGRELIRVKLRDPAYPFEVTLNFRTHAQRDVIEQWTEIRHQESRPVVCNAWRPVRCCFHQMPISPTSPGIGRRKCRT